MMYLFSIPTLLIVICYVLLRPWLAVATGMQKDLTRKWLWIPAVLISPLLYLVVVQLGHLKSPSWREWIIRIGIAGAAYFGIVRLGDGSYVNSDAVYEFKGTVATIFSNNIGRIEGRAIVTMDGNVFQNLHSTPPFPGAFAVAATAIIAGSLQFYGPVVKGVVLVVLFFFCSAATDIATYGLMVSAFANNQSPDWQTVVHDCRTFYNFYLWYLLMFGAAVIWARSDIRYERNAAEQPQMMRSAAAVGPQRPDELRKGR